MDLGTEIIIAAFGAAAIALVGHGTLAIVTIRKAHREARADYTAKIEESRRLVIEDMTKVVDAKFRVVDERISSIHVPTAEQVAGAVKLPPIPTADELAGAVRVPTTEQIADVVRAAIPEFPSIADGMQEWLSSPAGGSWAAALAGVIGESIQAAAAKKLEGVVGGMLRTDEARLAEVLRNVRFGNPMLDGVWGIAMGQPQMVHLVAGRLAKAFHVAGGLTNVLGNEHQALERGEAPPTEDYV